MLDYMREDMLGLALMAMLALAVGAFFIGVAVGTSITLNDPAICNQQEINHGTE